MLNSNTALGEGSYWFQRQLKGDDTEIGFEFDQSVEFAGMNFASLSILGYDRRINKYTYYGIDEMGTYAVTGEGIYNNDSKLLTLYGSTLDPTGKTTNMQDYKFVFDFVNDIEIRCDVVFMMLDKRADNS
jgi:hypothetical protein